MPRNDKRTGLDCIENTTEEFQISALVDGSAISAPPRAPILIPTKEFTSAPETIGGALDTKKFTPFSKPSEII